MGISFSNLNEPHSHAQAQSLSANCNSSSKNHHNHHHKTCVPLYPTRNPVDNNYTGGVELVPTCDHNVRTSRNMPHGYPGMMSPRIRLRDLGPFGAGGENFLLQRRPRFGYDDGWDAGLAGYGYAGRPDTICGYCGDMAHGGPCDGGQHGGDGGWSRARHMPGGPGRRGGDGGGGDFEAELATGLNNLSAALNGNGASGGCGPTCSANDGGVRVKGSVGDHDIDLKVGGKQKCPCDENGGCEASHRRVISRSRSRKRRERRGRKKMSRRENEGGGESSDGEQSRGRKRERGPFRGGEREEPNLQPRVDRLENDIQRLNNGWHYLKARITDWPRFPAQPELGLPNGSPFEPEGYGIGGLEPGGVPLGMRPRRRLRPMGGLNTLGGHDHTLRPGLTRFGPGIGRYPSERDGMDLDDDPAEPDLGIPEAMDGIRGERGRFERDDDLGPEFAGLEDMEVEPRMRIHRDMRRRTPGRGFRGKRTGLYSDRQGLRTTTRSRTLHPEGPTMSGGLGPAEYETALDDGNWDFPRQPPSSNRVSNEGSRRSKFTRGLHGYGETDIRKARVESAQESPYLEQRERSGGQDE